MWGPDDVPPGMTRVPGYRKFAQQDDPAAFELPPGLDYGGAWWPAIRAVIREEVAQKEKRDHAIRVATLVLVALTCVINLLYVLR